MEQFAKEHVEAFKEENVELAVKGGHPDDGNGWYAAKLSYKDWYDYNNAARGHLNFLETGIPVATMAAITAIY